MKKWKQKAIVQKVISYLPFGNKINYIFQKYVTKGVYLNDEYFFDRLGHAQSHLSAFRKYSTKELPQTALEIGTGWYPIVPIAFFLSGVDNVYSVDISMLTNKDRIQTTIDRFLKASEEGQLSNYLNIIPERLAALQSIKKDYESLSFEKVLEKLYLHYLVEDARKLSLADNSIDLVNSNNTFEHIYPQILEPILKEFTRVLNKKEGIMSHFIDMSDHFAHFDKSINIYNFLQFSDAQWSWIDNSIQPQNRLRYDDYLKMYERLALPITEYSFREGDVQAVSAIKLDKKYENCTPAQLAISHCHFVSKY